MSSIRKPSFPNPSTQRVESNLDKLKDAIEGARQADGKVDVEKLERAAASDPSLARGVEEIKDAYQRTETRTTTTCSGGTTTHDVQVDPTTLEAGEVQSVMSALMDAKAKVRGLDTNRDGHIDKGEAGAADQLTGLSGELAEGAVDGALAAYNKELEAWRDALASTASSIRGRRSFDKQLSDAASYHAESMTGADAILWGYRDLATRGQDLNLWQIRDKLEDAETSWLRHIPLFGRSVKTKRGHLSDREVCRLLGCDDLRDFTAQKRAAIEARLGGEFTATWLAGADLPGANQLDDPDAGPRADPDRVTSTC